MYVININIWTDIEKIEIRPNIESITYFEDR
jgi:hypothetical protein